MSSMANVATPATEGGPTPATPKRLRRRMRLGWLDLVLTVATVWALWWFFDRINGVLKYQWDWSVITRFLVKVDAKTGAILPNVLLEGLFTTLRLAFWGLLLATLIGLAMGAARTSRRLFPRLIAGAYVMLVRNVPPLRLCVYRQQSIWGQLKET